MAGNTTDKRAIVCVDDEVIIVLSLIQELRNYFGDQFIYESAMNAGEAMSILGELSEEGIEVAIIITDWLMPGMKGDDFLIKIREKNPGIKSILITGQADEKAVERAVKEANVCAVLRKPWYPDDLLNALRKCCPEIFDSMIMDL